MPGPFEHGSIAYYRIYVKGKLDFFCMLSHTGLMAEEYGKGYGKRPLWQWVVIYVVVGGLIYGVIYYFIMARGGGAPVVPGY